MMRILICSPNRCSIVICPIYANCRIALHFNQCHVTTPLCGPSRVCLLRGQYAHRTGIKTNRATGPMNNGFSGEYQLFRDKGWADDHLGSWLQQAGYRTMMVGKYAHGQVIPETVEGWDDLHISFGGAYYETVRYSTRYPVGQRRLKPDPDGYRTDLEADEICWLIEQHALRRKNESTEQPFFLYYAPLAPHKPSIGSPMLKRGLEDIAREVRLPDTPDFNEADISDKPEALQTALLTSSQIEMVHEEFRYRLITMVSVDQLIGRLMQTLRDQDLADNTYLFLTSDHGYQLGHNRMIAKKLPYHRVTHVPLWVTGPGIQAGSQSDHLVSHIDLAPTCLEMAGTDRDDSNPADQFDGKSLLPIMKHPGSIPANEFRAGLLIENWEAKGHLGIYVAATYSSYRTQQTIYTEWANGAKEFYDLGDDPYQLENRYPLLSPGTQLELSKELRALKNGMPKPIATIANEGLVNRKPVILGFAEDDDAIESVTVEVVRKTDGLFFNGQSWQQQPTSIVANLLNPGGLLTQWEIQPDLLTIEDQGEIEITAQSRNSAGELSDRVSNGLAVDAVEPETTLRLPADGSTVENEMMLFGVCKDNVHIRGIQFKLHRVSTNQYWDGKNWVGDEVVFVLDLNGHERWHTVLEIPDGEYHAWASAFDSAGNFDPSPSETHFFVK